MMKPVSSILFATNMTENCRAAFDFAASLATRYQASIVLLHVLEKLPNYVEGRIRGLLGDQQWKEISESHEQSARQFLIAKRPSSDLVREALDKFCIEAGINDAACTFVSREIVVRDGEIIDEIVAQAADSQCDLIVMGAREGGRLFTKETAIGPTIKGVLRRAKVPVLVVPPHSGEKES